MTIRSGLWLVLLICLGFLGNYLSLPLFFGADFLFGSIAVLLVLYFYGLGWGLLAALVVHSYTYFLWGHPYGYLNFVSEALFVGFFLNRGRRNLLALDGAFWLLLGMPLVWLEHSIFLHMDVTTTAFIMLKQAINGIFNALLASLIICFLPLGRIFQRPQPSPHIPLQEYLFNLLVTAILLPALLLTMLEAGKAKETLESQMVTELQSMSSNLQLNLHSWFHQHQQAVQELARLAGLSTMIPNAPLQHDTEVLEKAFPNFIALHVENALGRTIAFAPRVNEKGQSTLGHDFSDRPWFQESKATQQPVVSEVFHGRIGVFAPIVVITAPIFRDHQWLGTATATLNLRLVQDMLKPHSLGKDQSVTLSDAHHRVIATTAASRLPLQTWNWQAGGVIQPLGGDLYHWQPLDQKLPSMTRWQQSFYVQDIPLAPDLPWQLTIEVPVAPLQKTLYHIYVKNLTIMAILIALAMAFSLLLSRWLTKPLAQLSAVTTALPHKLSASQSIDWPATSSLEINSLITNVKSMAASLEENFHNIQMQRDELKQVNRELYLEILERRRAEQALTTSEARFRRLAENAPDLIFRMTVPEGRYEYVSPAATSISGYTPEEFYQSPLLLFHIIHPDWEDYCATQWQDIITGVVPPSCEYQIITKSGDEKWLNQRNILIKAEPGQPPAIEGIITDITERKLAEEALRKKLVALSRPLGDSESIKFSDLFNIDAIQQLQDLFAKSAGVASIITHPDGTPITKPSSFCRLCNDIIRQTDLGRSNCYYSDAIIGRHHPEGPIVQPCLSGGLWDAGASITVGGKHIANWLIGQVRNEAQSEANMRHYAQQIGADEETFLAAFYEVPTMSESQFQQVADALFALAHQLSSIAYQNVQQARFITERQEAEEALRQAKQFNQSIIDNVMEGVIVYDHEFRYLVWNRFMENLTGLAAAEVIGQNAFELFPHLQNAGIDDLMREALSGTTVFAPEHPYHIAATQRAGWAVSSYGPLYDNEGKIIGCIGLVRDITEQKQVQDEKAILEAQLAQAQKMEAIGTLAGGIAHDFNNILGAIIGFTELTQQAVPRDTQAHYNLDQVLKAGERAKDLVQQILVFSRQAAQEKRPLQLGPVIEETLKLLRASLPTTIAIHPNLNAPDALVLADPTQIHQILMNLGANAAHAMRDMGGRLDVGLEEVALEQSDLVQHPDLTPGPYVRLTVRDTGQGMAEDIQTRIFEPFFTTKAVGEGTGMGLAVVHGIVKASGGEITVTSQPGAGTAFTILLPQITGPVAPAPAVPLPLPTGSDSILFVDDETMLVNLTREMLQRLGYQVVAPTSSLEALQIFQAQPEKFDLVITDQTMPHLTGLQLAQEIKHLRPDIPIILCTGYSEKVSPENTKSAGINALLMKPIVMRKLAATIRTVLA